MTAGIHWNPVPECRGVYPVTWRRNRRWKVAVRVCGRLRHGGYFAECDEAAARRRAAELRNERARLQRV